MKLLAWLAGIGTLFAGAVYMVVSLNRWEWSRALFFGLIVVMAEIGLATGLVLRRMGRIESQRRDREARVALRDTRPELPDRFAWLKETTRGDLSVFITLLVGGGLILSAIAWIVDRLASKTSTPLIEQRLARRLETIAYPPGGLVVDDVTVLAQDVPGAGDEQLRKLLRNAGRT